MLINFFSTKARLEPSVRAIVQFDLPGRLRVTKGALSLELVCEMAVALLGTDLKHLERGLCFRDWSSSIFVSSMWDLFTVRQGR